MNPVTLNALCSHGALTHTAQPKTKLCALLLLRKHLFTTRAIEASNKIIQDDAKIPYRSQDKDETNLKKLWEKNMN